MLGFGVWGLGFGVWDLGFGVWDFGVWDLGMSLKGNQGGAGNGSLIQNPKSKIQNLNQMNPQQFFPIVCDRDYPES